jgi:hypothetical protein
MGDSKCMGITYNKKEMKNYKLLNEQPMFTGLCFIRVDDWHQGYLKKSIDLAINS